MTSQWHTNVNKARPRHAPTWRKTFKWTRFTTISKREWISTVTVYVYGVIWSIHFHSTKWNYDNRIGESPWRSWYYLTCIITRGLCSYNARLFNDDVTAIGVSYWRRREFPIYARLHRGKMFIHYHNSVDIPFRFNENFTAIMTFCAARSRATPRVRGGASNHGSWRKNVVNFHSTTII